MMTCKNSVIFSVAPAKEYGKVDRSAAAGRSRQSRLHSSAAGVAMQAGFTLLEVIVVLAVMGLLLGAAMPLAGAAIDADRRAETGKRLAAVGTALDSYFAQHASFPVVLDAPNFLGVHLLAGDGRSSLVDPFGAGQIFRYTVDPQALTAAVYSLGENGRDDGLQQEEHRVVVHGAVPGIRRTWQRLRLIVEVLANHLEGGGPLPGDWPAVCVTVGLGPSYLVDGFGTAWRWRAETHTLTSAGPDRVFDTADDIIL